jgi:hypothetical protein
MEDGKETYRSDLVEFIVPKLEHPGTESMEAITISDNPIPPNLPGINDDFYYLNIQSYFLAIVATDDEKTQEDFNAHEPKEEPKPDPNHLSQPIEKPKQHPKTYT